MLPRNTSSGYINLKFLACRVETTSEGGVKDNLCTCCALF